nr:hypothetical protein GCM10025732_44170 [Glycomyces mayteni]
MAGARGDPAPVLDLGGAAGGPAHDGHVVLGGGRDRGAEENIPASINPAAAAAAVRLRRVLNMPITCFLLWRSEIVRRAAIYPGGRRW